MAAKGWISVQCQSSNTKQNQQLETNYKPRKNME